MGRRNSAFLLTGALVALFCCPAPARAEIGSASWYGAESGRRTANGERFNPGGMTVAHRTLPFGTRLRITDLATGRVVVCRVTDRGPSVWTHRSIDLSRGCAAALGMLGRGVGRVRFEPTFLIRRRPDQPR